MTWNKQLGKDWRGSRPRCVLFMDGDREEVAKRLIELVGLPDVVVSSNDKWMPYSKPVRKGDGSWDKTPADESRLRKADGLIPAEAQKQLQNWWLAVQRGNPNTPNWDIASTCNINGKRGLILVEAKAHAKELNSKGKSLSRKASENSRKNHEQIFGAIAEANRKFQSEIGGDWNISRDSHYQLSNRFAWSWKLASLGVPVVLVYLGFLNADEMWDQGQPFHSQSEWECVLQDHCQSIVDNACWEQRLCFNDTPFIPVIRACDQPFDPKNP